MAGRCSSALSEPPMEASSVTAFWKAAAVMTSLGLMPRRTSSTTAAPVRRARKRRMLVGAGWRAPPEPSRPGPRPGSTAAGAEERADARAGVVLQRALDDLVLGGLAAQERGAQGLGVARLDLVVAGARGDKGAGEVDARPVAMSIAGTILSQLAM